MAALLPSNIAEDICRRQQKAEADRSVLDATCEEIARRCLPGYSGSFLGSGANRTKYAKKTEDMVDATAALALPRFAAAMESMLTPRSQRWHRLIPNDQALMRNKLVRMWFEDVTDILFRYRYAPKANYASQQHEVYMGLGAFGTGALFVDALRGPMDRGVRYRAIHLGEIYFLENHQGIIDTAFRKFPLTARQAAQQFDDLPKEIVDNAVKKEGSENEYWFIHCVSPRSEARGYDPGRADAAGMAYAADYVSITGKQMVRLKGQTADGGYHVFPYPISRYVIAPGETYGRSPAMLALPSINTLNEQKKTVLKHGHRAIAPPLFVPDDGVIDGLSLRPDAINYGGVDSSGRMMVHALQPGNLALAKEMMEAERAVINDAFLISLFQILIDTPQMTATEVLERAREKGALLSPTMGRQQSEALGPMIERELDVLSAQNLLPPMPPMLRDAQGQFDIIYDSPLSRAQRAESASGFMRWIDWAKEYVQLTGDPSPLDYADWDQAMPALADIGAVPPAWVKSTDQVAAQRQARAQQMQQKAMLEAAPSIAAVAKTAGPQARA